jgi:SAM-dependent methyltransferase
LVLVNFGCGLSACEGWKNYDASPTLKVQRIWLIGNLAKRWVKPIFPQDAEYGDIVSGLPLDTGVADRVYCSHVLEHLSLSDFRRALSEVNRLMKPGAVFRGVLPDLAHEVAAYMADDSVDACSNFMRRTCLGVNDGSGGLFSSIRSLLGNSKHLWMWDYNGLAAELEAAGFVDIRTAIYGDSQCSEFVSIEEPDRWTNCLGFECRKSLF